MWSNRAISRRSRSVTTCRRFSDFVVRIRVPENDAKRYFVARMFCVDPHRLTSGIIEKILAKSYNTASLFRMCFADNFGLGRLSVAKYVEVCECYHIEPIASVKVIENCVFIWSYADFMHTMRGSETIRNYTHMPSDVFQTCLTLMLQYKLIWQSTAESSPIIYSLSFRHSLSLILKCVAEWRLVIWETCNYRYSSRIENQAAELFKSFMERTNEFDLKSRNPKCAAATTVQCHWIDVGRWSNVNEKEAFPLFHCERLLSNRIIVWNAHLLSLYELEILVKNIHALWSVAALLQQQRQKKKNGSSAYYPIHICFGRDALYGKNCDRDEGQPSALDVVTRHLNESFKQRPYTTSETIVEGEILFSSSTHARSVTFPDENIHQFEEEDVARRYLVTGYLLGSDRIISGRLTNVHSPISFCKTNEFGKYFWPLYVEFKMIFVSITTNLASRYAINSYVVEKKREMGLFRHVLWQNNLLPNVTYKKCNAPKTLWRMKETNTNDGSNNVDRIQPIALTDSILFTNNCIRPLISSIATNDHTHQFELAECITYEELRHPVSYAVIFLDEFKRYPISQCLTRVDMYNLMTLVTVKLIFIGNKEDFPFLQ